PAHSGLNLLSDATVKSHRIESSENSIVALFILPAGWTWQPSPSQSMHGGALIMTHSGISSYGDSEVYLKIKFLNGTFRYLSAPLHAPVVVLDVASLELNILFLVGPTGTAYRALVNAHCVYEVL